MELRLVVFQICSADPFVVVLVMGGFDSVPSPSASHRDGLRGKFCPPVLGVLEKTQTGRRWLGECWFTFVWKPSGTNLASHAAPVEIRFNLWREEEYWVRGQNFGNAVWWESGYCLLGED